MVATSTQRAVEPVAESVCDSHRANSSASLTEFSLSHLAPYQQLTLAHQNPMCLLITRTPAGAQVCGHGCGLGAASSQATHICPFGLMMRRLSAVGPALPSRWLGRRFPTVQAMHETLDRLLGEGIDQETLLANLPPNPVVSADELRLAVQSREAQGPAPMAAAPVASSSAELGFMMEYLEQVHSLLATADRPETICERFLCAVATVVPFDDMAIYLRDGDGAQWVIAASVDCLGAGAQEGRPRPQACRLEPFGPGAAAIAQHKILVQHGDRIEPFSGEFSGSGTLAVPFPLGSGNVLGVWLASQGEPGQKRSPLVDDLVRFMRLLAEFLSARLQQVLELSAAGRGVKDLAETPFTPSHPRWEESDLLDALQPEVARATRLGQGVALVCLQVACLGDSVALPIEDMTHQFSLVLRPYDHFAASRELANTWYFVLPHAQELESRLVAARLLTVFEDVMDASGGAEEQGLRAVMGVSIWGADAASPRDMIHHALDAARLAVAGEQESVIHICSPQQDVVGL